MHNLSSTKGGHFQNIIMPARRVDGRAGGHFEKYNAHNLVNITFFRTCGWALPLHFSTTLVVSCDTWRVLLQVPNRYHWINK